jgi:hypothetical protein
MLGLSMDPRNDWLWNVVVPVVQWGAAVLVCVGLAVWLGGVIRRLEEEDVPGRRACPNCGYDVRATPDICPECGHVLPPPEPEEAEEPDMPVYTIPPGAGPFAVVEAPDKTFAVAEERALADPATSAKLGLVFIPCRDHQQAADIVERLNRGDHDGTIQVDLLAMPAGGKRENA